MIFAVICIFTPFLKGVAKVAGSITSPVQIGITKVTQSVGGTFAYWGRIKSVDKENASLKAENEKLKEENILRNEFSVLTPSLAETAEPIRLFKGIALNLQKRISDASDMESEFAALNDEFVKLNISHGGCADLLAICFLLYFICE